MKNKPLSPARRRALLALCALGLSAGASLLPVLTPAAQAAPKRILELWPGQRVLIVLPFTIGEDWNGGPELAEAVKPLIRSELQTALTNTGKFSITLPYRFDPILRRAVADNRISQDIITPFVDSPSLETAQPVFTELKFDQVPMAAQVQLEELRVGGTAKKPTLQMQVSAKLYQIGDAAPFRSVVITSDPVEGRTPEERIQKSAANAFQQVADYFVKAPDTFQLPASLDVIAGDSMGKSAMAGDAKMPKKATGSAPATPKPVAPAMAPAAPAKVDATKPNMMAPQTGTAVIPNVPAGDPPLGLDVPGEKALGR